MYRNIQGIKQSATFLALATKDYLESLRNDDTTIKECIELARALKKPVFLVIEKALTKQEIAELKHHFKGEKVATYYRGKTHEN